MAACQAKFQPPKLVSYRLKKGHKPSRSLASAVNRQVSAAIRQVLTAGPGNPEAVHQVRMHLKKIRAALRLIRSVLGERHEAQTSALRDAARLLSACRDDEVLLATFDRLSAKLPQTERSGLAAVREGLVERWTAAMQVCPADRVRWLLALIRLRSVLRPWPAVRGAAVASGWTDGFKRARKSWRELAENCHADRVHEWRKRVKTHWYHSRLLRTFTPDASRHRRRQLRDLSDMLGDFHDLELLRDHLASQPEAFGGADPVASFERVADAEQSGLLEKALALGRELFDGKPERIGPTC